MSLKKGKKISIERRPTSASVVDQNIELLPQEPLKFTSTKRLPHTLQDGNHQVSIDSLHMSFYTQYRTSVFFLKMDFMLNKTQITVSLSSFESRQLQPSLKLGESADIQLSAIQRDIDYLLRNWSNSHVGNYYCEQKDSLFIPIFEVVFPSESSLKYFLENRKDIEEGLVRKLTNRVPKSALRLDLTVKLELYLAVTTPMSARRAIRVNNENCQSCMQTYLSSFTFSISELLQVESSSPITELDDLMSALHSVVDWFTLGLKFQVPVAELDKIRVAHNADVDNCKRDMLILCLRQNELTWLGVVNALHEMNYNNLASDIAKKYGIISPVEAVNPQEMQIPVEVSKEEGLKKNDEKQKLEKHIQELKKQIQQKQELDLQAKCQQDQLEQSKDLIAKLERDKDELMKQQSRQLNLSTSLHESNRKLQDDIREKDKELKEERDKCTKLHDDLLKTKERLKDKTDEVKCLQSTVESLKEFLISKEVTNSSVINITTTELDKEGHENENVSQGVETDSPNVNVDITSEMTAQVSIKFVKPPCSYTTIGTEETVHFVVEGTGTQMLNVSAQLKRIKGPSHKTAQVNRKDNSQYEVVYTPDEGGNHMLDIYIDKKLGSTQPVTVYPNPCKPLLPFRSIPFNNIPEFEAPLETDVDSQGRLWIAQSDCVSVVDCNLTTNDTVVRGHPLIQRNGIVSVSVAEDDSVFVIAGHNLLKTDLRGQIVKCIEMKESKSWDYPDPPSHIRAHRGRVYVYFRDCSQIWVYGCGLERRIGTINLGGNDIDIEFDRNEDVIYVLRNKEIQVLSMKGEKKKTIPFDVSDSTCRKVCVAGNYFYVITETRIIVLKTSGEYVKSIQRHDGAQPYFMTVGRDGHIYVCCQQNTFTGDSWEGKVIVY